MKNFGSRFLMIFCIVFLLASLTPVSYAKREENQPLFILFQKTQNMESGEARTANLEQIVQQDKKFRYGLWAIEELMQVYLEENNREGIINFLDQYRKSASINYSLKMEIARFLYSTDFDKNTILEFMVESLINVDDARKYADEKYPEFYWYNRTDEIQADIESQIAAICHETGKADSAWAFIHSARGKRSLPDDYYLLGKMLMDKSKFREAMGTLMFSMYRGDLSGARKLFKSAYDSLNWDPMLYDEYVEKFGDLYYNQDLENAKKFRPRGKARDAEYLKVSTLVANGSGVLLFWGDDVNTSDWSTLQELVTLFKSRNIPFKLVYIGDDMISRIEMAKNAGFDFGESIEGEFKMLNQYHIDIMPALYIVEPTMRLAFRLDGSNHSMPRLFEDIWKLHNQETEAASN